MSRLLMGGLLAVSLALGACGRTPTAQSDEPDLPYIYPDGWSPTDGGPDRRIPPPPTDFWPPPPPVDGWPPPPPMDFWPPPPPTDGPCVATCIQKCQLLKNCGLLPGGVGQCANQQCPGWPASQSSCLANLVCYPVPGPICSFVQQCVVNPNQQPDLTITSFKATVQGSNVTYTITTCNQGKGASGNFFVDLYYDRTSPPGLQEFGDQYNSYGAGLAPGACNNTTFTRANTPAGSYSSWAQVDADGIVAESVESNNVAGPIKVTVSSPPPPKGPDLVIQSMTATVYGTTSVTVRYQMVICNIGTDPSSGTQVHVYYNQAGAPAPGQPGDKLTTVPGLQPGNCSTRNVYRYGTPQGTYTSWAQVDPNNQVTETIETNNVSGPAQVTVGTTPGADLTIKVFDHTILGQSTVRYRMQVCNVGTGSTGFTVVHVYFNQATAPSSGSPGDQSTYVPMLQPGACTYRYVYRQGTPQGTYTSWAQVDPYNQITETNESNNVTGPIKVIVGGTGQKADLSFKSFTANLVQSPIGTTLAYSMVVCNTGQAAATSFRVDVYYNRATPPAVSQYGNTFQYVPALGVGACTTVNRNYFNPPAGTYTSWAQVDAANQVSETNESNNVAGPQLVVVGSTPPPPPPPPPGVCPDLCNYVINTCKFLPASQYWVCIGACENLTPDKITCAQNAKAQNQCNQLLLCMN